jgi:hypothetical protein
MNDSPCRYRVELEVLRRRCNGLNVEIGIPIPRCRLKPPEEWPNGAVMVGRWLLSGGSPLVLGHCTPGNCPPEKDP